VVRGPATLGPYWLRGTHGLHAVYFPGYQAVCGATGGRRTGTLQEVSSMAGAWATGLDTRAKGGARKVDVMPSRYFKPRSAAS
jgi:hypothetical protein